MIIVGTVKVTEERIDDARGTSQVRTLGGVRVQLSLAEEVRYVVAFNTGKING